VALFVYLNSNGIWPLFQANDSIRSLAVLERKKSKNLQRTQHWKVESTRAAQNSPGGKSQGEPQLELTLTGVKTRNLLRKKMIQVADPV